MKNEKIKFKDRLKDISSGLGDSLKESTLWGSILDLVLHLGKAIPIAQETDLMLL